MALLMPDMMLERVVRLTPEQLSERGISALLLDVDNTLASHGHPIPLDGVAEWVEQMKTAGISMLLISNNNAERVSPFARRLGLDFIALAAKPLPFGARRGCRTMGIDRRKTAIVGDQIYTDMLAGHLAGLYCILVEKVDETESFSFRLRRRLEKRVIRRYRRREEKSRAKNGTHPQ